MNEMEYMEENTEETCDIKAFERNKYFYGKLMTVRDFETEQRYFNSKRGTLNRLIHGIGIVCGLKVEEAEIADQKLRLKLSKGGVALDCCGREIVIEDAGTYDVDGSPVEGTNYVYLKYLECLKEPVPALSNPSACEEACCYSRIKESFKLELSQQAPQVDVPLNWKEKWQEREQDIKNLASRLGISDPLGTLIAKLSVSADELKTAGCPSCDDPKVLLAVIKVTGSDVDVDTDETLYRRSIVYTNPMLYELLRSHLTDVDNPHQVTAQQTGALVSVDGVDNPGGDVDLAAKNAITIAPDNNNNRITIGEDHSAKKDNPHNVTAAQAGALVSVDGVDNPGGDVDLVAQNAITIASDNKNDRITIGENHSARQDNPHNVTIAQTGALKSVDGVDNPGGDVDLVAKNAITIASDNKNNQIIIGEDHSVRKDNPHNVTMAQTGALKSVDGISSPGGNIDLVEGEGITIEPDPAALAIKISATGAGGISGANTGIIQLTIPKATAGEQPGYVVSRGIAHELKTELSPAIILGLVAANGIIMEEDFVTQRELIELMAKVYDMQAPPPVSFRALAVTNKTFDILAINMNPEVEETILIRWWAVPATKTIGGKDIGGITGEIRVTLGEAYINTLAKEKNIAESEVNWVIEQVITAVSAEPSGATMTGISQATGTKTETIQPAIEAMVAAGFLVATGTGTKRKYSVKR